MEGLRLWGNHRAHVALVCLPALLSASVQLLDSLDPVQTHNETSCSLVLWSHHHVGGGDCSTEAGPVSGVGS